MERVIASVRINRNTDIAVEVKSVFKTGDGRRVAVVEALPVNGLQIKPFTDYSIGGPSQSATANIRLEFLHGLSRVKELPPQNRPPAAKKATVALVDVGGKDYQVEVIDTYQTPHGERIATVRALPINGKQVTPFFNLSIDRGNAKTDTIRIPLADLRGLSLVDLGGAA